VRLRDGLRRAGEKGRLVDGADEVFSRISFAGEVAALADADFVVEAVPEAEDLKRSVMAALDAVAPRHAVLATNTSSIPVTRLAAATSRPERVVGMHFMNPVPKMALVELVRGVQTGDAAFAATERLARHLGKTICASADRPGFVVNRILMPMVNEAFYALMEGVASREDIDAGMRLGTNQPMGPLQLADMIGLDTCLAVMKVLHQGLGDSKYRPCPLLAQYVDAGWTGRKTGRGVYEYSEGGRWPLQF
jgi:3-hydroxybutyryl-CoA dehydrogenase